MKSWKEVERLTKAKDKVAKEMEEIAQSLIAKSQEMIALNLEQFKMAPEVDTLMESSPISKTRMLNDFRRHLIKMGCPWEKPFYGPEIESFSDSVRQGNKWVLKMRPKNLKPHEEI